MSYRKYSKKMAKKFFNHFIAAIILPKKVESYRRIKSSKKTAELIILIVVCSFFSIMDYCIPNNCMQIVYIFN